MQRIFLISCVSKKQNKISKAKELYISPLFKFAYKYAKSQNPDKIFILSAKYGLLNPETIIEPYNQTLNKMSQEEIKIWAEKVLTELKKVSNTNEDLFTFLAGKNYRKYLEKEIKNYEVPMKNLGIGKQLKFLKEKKNVQRM